MLSWKFWLKYQGTIVTEHQSKVWADDKDKISKEIFQIWLPVFSVFGLRNPSRVSRGEIHGGFCGKNFFGEICGVTCSLPSSLVGESSRRPTSQPLGELDVRPLWLGTHSDLVLAGSGKLLDEKRAWIWTALATETRILGTRWGRDRGKFT